MVPSWLRLYSYSVAHSESISSCIDSSCYWSSASYCCLKVGLTATRDNHNATHCCSNVVISKVASLLLQYS